MVVYADVLIFLNIILTYLILISTGKISRVKIKIKRIVLASVVGGATSLYIFVPKQSFFIENIIKLLFSLIITSLAFGTRPIKSYLRTSFCFFATSFIYAGFMMAFWYVLKPNGMIINNGIVYFNIKPLVLIIATVICYLLIMLFLSLLKKDTENCDVTDVILCFKDKKVNVRCMVDTGNGISDYISDCKVIIVSNDTANRIIGDRKSESILNLTPCGELKKRFRVFPFRTISGNGILPSVKIDYAEASGNKYCNVYMGISKEIFSGEYDAIISPEFLTR